MGERGRLSSTKLFVQKLSIVALQARVAAFVVQNGTVASGLTQFRLAVKGGSRRRYVHSCRFISSAECGKTCDTAEATRIERRVGKVISWQRSVFLRLIIIFHSCPFQAWTC
jgi:hypothetical protein